MPNTTSASPAPAARATIRMYRQGLGDFLLLTLPRVDQAEPFRMLIDCGVILGTQNAGPNMSRLVAELAADVNGKLDVVVVTHHHWDHVSGFIQAQDAFAGIQVGEVWASWIDDPSDVQGRQILDTHGKAETALRVTAERMRMSGLAAADQLDSLLDFRGDPLPAAAGGGSSTDAAVASALGLAKGRVRYLRPGDPPVRIPGVMANIYALGPPRDLALLGRMDPSSANPETYGFAALAGLINDLGPASGDDPERPFGPNQTIMLDQAPPQLPSLTAYRDPAQAWRQIDQDWLGGASALALAFDKAVNNTSLVLAVELDDGIDVLLFAADAQVGNWLSWQALKWTMPDGRVVNGPDLLARTVAYKVGHHASHNATLAAQGLELMQRLQVALICIDQQMAVKKRWLGMPFPALLDSLDNHTGRRTLRADQPIPPAATQAHRGGGPTGDDYYEVIV